MITTSTATTAATIPWSRLLLACFFGGWVMAFNAISIVYLINIYRRRDHFQIRIRLPSLWITEAFVYDQLTLTTQGLREVAVALGWHFPDAMQDLSLVLFVVTFLTLSPLRPLQLIIIYDPALRRSCHSRMKRAKTLLFITVLLLSIALFVAMEQRAVNGCIKMSVL